MAIKPDPEHEFCFDYSNANLDEIIEQIAEINDGFDEVLEILRHADKRMEEMGLYKPYRGPNFVNTSITFFDKLSEAFLKILNEIEIEIKRAHIRRLKSASGTLSMLWDEADKNDSRVLARAHPAISRARSSVLEYSLTLGEELFGLPERLRELLKSQIFSPGKKSLRTKDRVTPIYRLGTKSWTDVKIEFISEEEVVISIADESLGGKNYRVLGFEDKRTGDPKLIWSKTLLFLARADGYLQIFDDQISEKDLGVLKKRISDLRTHLKLLFNTSQDPFYPTEYAKGYKSRFIIFEREAAVPNQTIDQFEEDIRQREKYDPKGIRHQHLKDIGKAKRR